MQEMQETWIWSWVWVGNIPWSRKWHPASVFLPGKFDRQRSLACYSPWGCKVRCNWAHKHTHPHTHTHVTSASIFILKQCVNSLWSHSTKNNEASGTLQAWRAWHHVLLCLFFFNIYLFGCIRSYCGTWDRLLRHGLSTWCTEHAGLAAVACGLSCSVAYGILVPQPRFRPMHCAVNS